jgi:hypothetical protein
MTAPDVLSRSLFPPSVVSQKFFTKVKASMISALIREVLYKSQSIDDIRVDSLKHKIRSTKSVLFSRRSRKSETMTKIRII